ncbi:putative disease resistance RPP13-like protein 1 [Durio zibethinus]|uniref:Disease resistance RPP13-like protein 1 n=1 Tax=Durio zibethinus TaxID=66656 RepID=A0A6P5Z6C8_DURZI|nr:putative disease resistance RPP13-like protein 1 [Durio zibethinus]
MSLLSEALSAIREVVVSNFFDYLLDKLGSFQFFQFPGEKQIQEELEKLKKELLEIRALLDDAEERQIKEQSVKIWLSDLQNMAYDVDDVVDEVETEIARRNLKLERHGSSSKKSRLDTFNDVFCNSDMMSKIKDITSRLKDLEPRKNQLQLRMIDCSKSNRIKELQQPTSLEIETQVYGRDKDKGTILELVFNGDDNGNFVIPIVGMGGIGKTTLAQLVYNDATVHDHFDLKAWVCVSDDFDVTRITKAIFQAVTSEPCNDNDLNSLQRKLKETLSGKNFLIVLDDVWNENYHDWTILQSPFLTRTPASKIIVTTRSFAVSSAMGASFAHSLEVLSEDGCLSVFAQHALGAKDFEGHPNLKEVAEKIVRKCNGLPLAAKTLGGLARTDVDLDAWEKILESEIWKLSDHRFDIIPALQLSYHHLPPHLKRCFAYCSILPKDYEFQEKEIILLWRAEGFLREARDKRSIEDLGHKYFRDLVSRSLLQISNQDRSRFVMHDLINDLAQSIAGDICFKIEGGQKTLKHTRHLSYIGGMYDGIKKFIGISEAQRLRTFLPFRLSNYMPCWVTNDVLTHLLPNLKCLRVLSLEGYLIYKLPDFIGDLKHLRYLNLSRTFIKCLPESISTLYNLETLLLSWCVELEKLPSEMENLVNLCYLDITGINRLEGMPSNFCRLSDLQTLSKFILQKGKGCQIRELGGLSNLKGQLCISGLENVVEAQDARKAKLHEKSGLDKLELMWSEDFNNRNGEIETEVLDLLHPSTKLKELGLRCYYGMRLVKWIGDSSFNKLLSLCLEFCPNCISLPSFGQLPLLENLIIKALDNVTSVGVEFFGKNAPNAFPSLETLEFENMLKWENWNFCEVNEEARKFPKLRELRIVNCPELLGSIPENLPSLEKLVISYCEKLVISIQSLPMLSELDIEGCHGIVYKGFVDDSSLKRVCFSRIPKFTCAAEWLTLGSIKVESLKVDDCEELYSLQENNWGLLTQSISLGELSIGKWSQLVSIGAEEEREELMQLKIPCTIQKLTIRDCERLEKLSKTLHYVSSLRVLEFWSCPNLISLSNNNLPKNLKSLVIIGCTNIRCLFEEGENVNIGSVCLLEHLNISSCPSLISLSNNNLPSNLKSLAIIDCKNLRCLLEEGENINLSSACLLERLYVDNCPSLKVVCPPQTSKSSASVHVKNSKLCPTVFTTSAV